MCSRIAAWPETGRSLAAELRRHPGRLALALAGPDLDEGIRALASVFGGPVTRVGAVMTRGSSPQSEDDVRSRLSEASVLTDLEILFWKPLLDLDVLRLLTRLARERPMVAVWPGRIDGRRASYSSPGRQDYFEGQLSDVVVLRPRRRRFPDQAPFELERIPA